MPTNMVRDAGVSPVSPLQDGVQATLRLVTGPELDHTSGVYYDGLQPSEPHPQARDAGARQHLRRLSDQLCGLDRVRG
jgi:hypothetical protein